MDLTISTPPAITRQCGPCQLCCKTFANSELRKPEDTWCQHAAGKGKGCRIHASRPAECKGFSCMWLMGALPEEWRPDNVKIVVDLLPNDLQGSFLHPMFRDQSILFLRVTQDYPGAWRRPEAMSVIRSLVGQKAPSGHFMLTAIQGRGTWTLFNGQDEMEFAHMAHELGDYWAPVGGEADAKAYLDRHLHDEKFMAMRAEAKAILEKLSPGEQTQTAQLAQHGTVFVEPHRYAAIEEYAAFLRRWMPERTYEVKVMEMPPGWEQFSTKGE